MTADKHNALRVTIAEGRNGLEFDSAAQDFLGCNAFVAEAALEELALEVVSPGPRVSLGAWLWHTAQRADVRGAWGLACEGARWFDAVVTRGEILLLPDAGTAPLKQNAPGKSVTHTMRNQLNSVQMNAELLVALAEQHGDQQITQTAERVLRNARSLRDSLHDLAAERDVLADPRDLATELRGMLDGVGVARDVLDIAGTAVVSRAECALVALLVLEWLGPAHAPISDRNTASPMRSEPGPGTPRVRVAAGPEHVEIEAVAGANWVNAWADRLSMRLDADADASPTRLLRGSGLGVGFWCAGPDLRARLGLGAARSAPASR